MVEGIRNLSPASFIRVLIPFMRTLPPKGPSSNTIILALGFNIGIWGVGINISVHSTGVVRTGEFKNLRIRAETDWMKDGMEEVGRRREAAGFLIWATG